MYRYLNTDIHLRAVLRTSLHSFVPPSAPQPWSQDGKTGAVQEVQEGAPLPPSSCPRLEQASSVQSETVFPRIVSRPSHVVSSRSSSLPFRDRS